MKLIIHTDGGARGNPGPAAIGVVIEGDERASGKGVNSQVGVRRELAAFGKVIGESTNNVAEYTAVIEAYRYILKTRIHVKPAPIESIDFYLDSTLVVNQLNGLFKIKNSRLRELLTDIRVLEAEVGGNVQYIAVPREANTRADYFVNAAMDGLL